MFISPIIVKGMFLCNFIMFVIKISRSSNSSTNLIILHIGDVYIHIEFRNLDYYFFIIVRMQFASRMLYSVFICSMSFFIKTTTPSLL